MDTVYMFVYIAKIDQICLVAFNKEKVQKLVNFKSEDIYFEAEINPV